MVRSSDMAFNEDGVVRIALPNGGYASANDAAIQADGKVVVAGYSSFHDGYSDKAVILSRLAAY